MVRFDVFMWVIAILWIIFPEGSYGGFWMTGGVILLSLAAGAKLHVVAMHLARNAYSRYYRPYPKQEAARAQSQGKQPGAHAHGSWLRHCRDNPAEVDVARGGFGTHRCGTCAPPCARVGLMPRWVASAGLAEHSNRHRTTSAGQCPQPHAPQSRRGCRACEHACRSGLAGQAGRWRGRVRRASG